MPPASTAAQQGFSLLEAIVALVILAGSCMALFAWMNSSLTQLQRAELYVDAGPAIASASQYLKTVDLAQRPQGVFVSSGVEVRWQAVPIEAEVSRSAAYGGSNFILSLYQVELTASTAARELPVLHTRVVNYRLKPGLPDPASGI